MREYIKKFSTLASANNYEIADIPFTTSLINSAGTPVNLVCNEEHKKINVDEGGLVIKSIPFVFIGNGSWDNSNNWEGGCIPSVNKPDIIVSGALVIDSHIIVNSLTITSGCCVTVDSGGTLDVFGNSESSATYGDLYIRDSGIVKLYGTLNVNDFVIETSFTVSGQLINGENIVCTNAYIDVNLDPSGVASDQLWYMFGIPFDVDVLNGVSRKEGNTYRKCTYNTDYLIWKYDAYTRYTTGNGWIRVKDGTLNGGEVYQIGVDGNYNTYRFKASGDFYSDVTEKELIITGTGENANWNGITPKTFQYVSLGFSNTDNPPTQIYIYRNGQSKYEQVQVDGYVCAVGSPFMVQPAQAATIQFIKNNE